jgi:1,4-dihydroxy-2-naphthoyl-CoA synthase
MKEIEIPKKIAPTTSCATSTTLASSCFDTSSTTTGVSSTSTSRVKAYYGPTLLVEERSSGILLVALYAPKSRNAFSDQMYQDLIHVFDYATHNEHIVAVVLTGHGPYFSSGANLKELPNQQPASAQVEKDTTTTSTTILQRNTL